MNRTYWIFGLVVMLLLVGCTLDEIAPPVEEEGAGAPSDAVTGRVISVTDGDTINVSIGGESYRVRYVGINTPERDEPCYNEASQANAALVEGQEVRLVPDTTDTDRFGRLLRYVYVGDTFVNRELVEDGYAEAALYRPDDRHFETFRQLETEAARRNLNCHATGIFDDDNPER
jgi:endonuclease YncB( thermonuclease family)